MNYYSTSTFPYYIDSTETLTGSITVNPSSLNTGAVTIGSPYSYAPTGAINYSNASKLTLSIPHPENTEGKIVFTNDLDKLEKKVDALDKKLNEILDLLREVAFTPKVGILYNEFEESWEEKVELEEKEAPAEDPLPDSP
jgi:hypothetical protein